MSATHRYGLLWLLLWLSLGCEAQLSHYSLKFKLSKRNFVDSIAISFEHGRLLLPVTIGGRTYRFMLDTGASQTTIYDDTPIEGAHGIGFIVSYDAQNRPDTVDKVALPTMQIGTLQLQRCQAVVQQRLGRRKDIDGILGFDLVCKGLLMKIDVRNNLLVITDRRSLFKHEAGTDVRYELRRHVPYVDVSPFSDHSERVLFDTGSPHFFMLNKQHFDSLEQQYPERIQPLVLERKTGRRSRSHYGAEPVGEIITLQLDSLCIGTLLLPDAPCETTRLGSHIGSALLERASVVFFPKRRTLRLQPYRSSP